jgi:DNA-binding MarR family transcriptional regulator
VTSAETPQADVVDGELPQAFIARLPLLFARAGGDVAAAAEPGFASLGITPMDYLVLAVLSADEPGSQRELALACGKGPAVMVSLVDELAEKELVERERDPKDRRRSIVRLTKAGRTVLADADREAERVEAELLVALSEDERTQLRELLVRALNAVPAISHG